MAVSLSELIEVWGEPAKVIGTPHYSIIERLILDSRSALAGPGSIYFAYKGTHHDGHSYIPELVAKGIQFWVVQDLTSLPDNLQGYVWVHPNPIASLQTLAAFHRSKFQIPIVAITGSNGKTIVKEWLGQILAGIIPLVKSPKSYNSQTGVPLSVWQLNERHQLGIFEAGISRPGEMDALRQVIRPTIGIFTNLGSAHDEGFTSKQEKLIEKLKLFSNCKYFIYHRSGAFGQLAADSLSANIEKFGWDIKTTDNGRFSWQGPTDKWEGKTPFTDSASLENLGHCLALCNLLDINKERVLEAVENLSYPEMRLTVKNGVNGCLLVDDCYNNDLAGLEIALEFSNRQQVPGKKKIAILSEPKESGLEQSVLYEKVANLLNSFNFDELYWLGNVPPHWQGVSYHFNNLDSLLFSLNQAQPQNALILIKGGRSEKFEQIVGLLQLKLSGLRLEINMEALAGNLNAYRNWVGPKVKLMAMVKALAYGAGGVETARLMEYQGADYLAVAYPDEGVELRQNGISLPIMVMNASPDTWPKLAAWGLEPVIFSLEDLSKYLNFAKQLGEKTPDYHLEVNTGMNRLGLEPDELASVIELIKPEGLNAKVASIFSHLAASESPEFDDFTETQINSFDHLTQKITDALGYRPLRHILNSAGIERFTHAYFDMVRMGIGLYGVSPVSRSGINLKSIGALKTTVSQVREIAPGESVGYGRKGTAEKARKIATIAIGYADGYNRNLGHGKAYFLINGQKAPTVGSICMDMTMADVTGIEVKPGDEVIVFNHELTVSKLAEWWGTIPYEVLTSLGNRVKRVFFAA